MTASRNEPRIAIVRVALVALVMILPNRGTPAEAQQHCAPGFFEKQRLFDSCIRDLIAGHGITFDGDYIGDFFGNPSGGRSQKFRSAWRSTFGLNFDLDHILEINGATLRVSGAWTAGRNLATDVETILNPAEIYGLKGARFWELSWQQKLFDDQLSLVIGRHSPADQFSVQPPVWDTTNLAFFSLSLLYNDFAFRSRPIGMWGVSGRYDPKESPIYVAGGVFSGAPRNIQRTSANGLDFRFKFGESTLVVGEAGYKKGQSPGDTSLPGTYRAGIVYNSARFNSLNTPGRSKRGNVNLYLSGEQMLYREEGTETQGLNAFAFLNVPVSDDINLIKFFFAGGLSYKGLFDGRDDDRTYTGFAFADLNNAVQQLASLSVHGPDIVPNQPHEAVIELGHVFQITPFWAITPAVQYIINPGLTNNVKNAVALGVQTVVDF